MNCSSLSRNWMVRAVRRPNGLGRAIFWSPGFKHSPLAWSRSLTTTTPYLEAKNSPDVSANESEVDTETPDGKSLPKRASSLVNSILHGSPKARKDAQETFSRLLARGKYVHELCEHNVKPDCVDEYAAVISEFYPRLVADLSPKVKLCGSWLTDVGKLDTFFHIWEYKGYPEYSELVAQMRHNPVYQDFQRCCQKLLVSRNNHIMLEFAFWPTSPPVTTNGIYELRSYRLKPGHLLEWESNWRRGIECRRSLEHPIGAWFSQLGHLNYVHHMWAYPDLEVRKRTREEAWSNEGWAQTVYNTVRLIDEMQSNILTPLPFSPLK